MQTDFLTRAPCEVLNLPLTRQSATAADQPQPPTNPPYLQAAAAACEKQNLEDPEPPTQVVAYFVFLKLSLYPEMR